MKNANKIFVFQKRGVSGFTSLVRRELKEEDNCVLFAHKTVCGFSNRNQVAIDATLGGGKDFLFLCEKMSEGAVFGFDVQERAVEKSRKRVERRKMEDNKNIAEYHLFQTGHENLSKHVPQHFFGKVNVVMFNLGYMISKGSDKSKITKKETTIEALEQSLQIVSKENFLISVVMYNAHEEGREESKALKQWASILSPQKPFFFTNYFFPHTPKRNEILFISSKQV